MARVPGTDLSPGCRYELPRDKHTNKHANMHENIRAWRKRRRRVEASVDLDHSNNRKKKEKKTICILKASENWCIFIFRALSRRPEHTAFHPLTKHTQVFARRVSHLTCHQKRGNSQERHRLPSKHHGYLPSPPSAPAEYLCNCLSWVKPSHRTVHKTTQGFSHQDPQYGTT